MEVGLFFFVSGFLVLIVGCIAILCFRDRERSSLCLSRGKEVATGVLREGRKQATNNIPFLEQPQGKNKDSERAT